MDDPAASPVGDFMETALLLGRFLLAGVFGVAGVAKLRDLEGSRRGVRDFGVPEGLAGPLGVVLPLAELAVALALLPAATAWWGALGAAGLLLVFVAAISVNLARGRKPDCRCFGQIASGPIGPSTLARNGVLLVVAAALVVQGPARPGPGLTEWLAEAGSGGLALVVGGLGLGGAGGGGWGARTRAGG